jgi:hypothetical protein
MLASMNDIHTSYIYTYTHTHTYIHIHKQDAGVKKSDIDEIVLVGGSTRIPKIQTVCLYVSVSECIYLHDVARLLKFMFACVHTFGNMTRLSVCMHVCY